MKILAVDVGTGTQDILLFDTRLNVENSFKLVVPSPTMIIHRKIKNATKNGSGICLTGVTMGGGPSHWAAMDHLKAGYSVFATPLAARSFDDDLSEVKKMGITPFCITIDLEAKEYLSYLFGKNGYLLIRDSQKLPKALPQIYMNLTQ